MHSDGQRAGLAPQEQDRLISGLLDGQPAAERDLLAAIEGPVRANVTRFLGVDHLDVDDVVQDCLVAIVGYIRRKGGFEGNVQVFAVTVARNRCRSHLALSRMKGHVDVDDTAFHLADERPSPLDLCERDSIRAAVRDALARLDEACRDLLTSLFVREIPVTDLRVRLGLGSVQAVYHRRNVCLEKVTGLLNDRCFSGSA